MQVNPDPLRVSHSIHPVSQPKLKKETQKTEKMLTHMAHFSKVLMKNVAKAVTLASPVNAQTITHVFKKAIKK